MGVIQFTRLERGNRIIRRFGEFSIIASPRGLEIDGHMWISPRGHGSNELSVIKEQIELAWTECSGKSEPDAPLVMKRGAGVHPKKGRFCAYQAQGLVIKISKDATEIIGTNFKLNNGKAIEDLAALMIKIIEDRAEVVMPVREAS